MKDFNIDLAKLKPLPNWRRARPGGILIAYPKGEEGKPHAPIAGMRVSMPTEPFRIEGVLALSATYAGKIFTEEGLLEHAIDITDLASVAISTRDLTHRSSPVCLAYADVSESRSYWVRSEHRQGGFAGWVLIHGSHPHASVGAWVTDGPSPTILGAIPRIRIADNGETIFL